MNLPASPGPSRVPRLWLPLGFLAVFALGCPGTIPAQTKLEVAFVSPTDNAQFSLASDRDPTRDGVQQDVRVRFDDTAGRTVTLKSYEVETRLSTATTFTAGPPGTVTGQNVLFPGVTLGNGVNVVRVTIVESGSNRTATASITVGANSTRPVVTGITFLQDANHDSRLNAAELPPGTSPVAHVSTVGLEDGQTVRMEDASTGTLYGSAVVSGGKADVTLGALPANDDATYALVASVTNAAGVGNNISTATPGDPLDSGAFLTLSVDRVKPTLTFTALAKTLLGVSDDVDGASPGFQVAVAGHTDADVGQGGISLTVSPPDPAPASTLDANGGAFSTQLTVAAASGTKTTFTVTGVAMDLAGNLSDPKTLTFTVDLTSPVISSVTAKGAAPSAAWPIADNGALSVVAASNTHVAATESGYISDLSPGTSGGQMTLGTTVTGAIGGTLTLSYGGAPVAGTTTSLTSSPQNVTFSSITLADNTTGDLVLTVTSVSGNVSQYTLKTAVHVTSPTFAFTALAKTLFGSADDADPAAAGFQVLVRGVTSTSVGANGVILSVAPPGSGSSAVTPASGTFSTPLTVAATPGATTSFIVTGHAEDPFGNISGNASLTFTVDLLAPVISGLSFSGKVPDINSGGAAPHEFTGVTDGSVWSLVSLANVHFWPTVIWGYAAELDPTVAGGQLILNYTVNHAVGTTATVSYNGAALGMTAVGSDGQLISQPVTLPDGTQHDLIIQVVRPSGNTATLTMHMTVDVVPPPAPSGVTATLAGIAPGTKRVPQVNLGWTRDPTSEVLSGWDVRWTTEHAVANGATTDLKFFKAESSVQASAGLVPAASSTFQLNHSTPGTTLPPLNTYWFQVRAVDAVGNESALSSPASVTDNTSFTMTAVANPASADTSGSFGITTLGVGDFNGDSKDDLVVAAYSTNTVNVFYGNSALTFSTGAGTLQVLKPADVATETGQAYGTEIAVGKTHTAAGATTDLLVGANFWNGASGRALLYFGASGSALATTPAVEFHGPANSFFGERVFMVGDVNNDGRTDFLITSPGENGLAGAAYLFYGREASAWGALGTGSNPVVVSSTRADRKLTGNDSTQGFFGDGRGTTALGDLTGDNNGDFLLTSARDDSNLVTVYSGASASASLTVADALQLLAIPSSADSIGTTDGEFAGFGASAVGNVNLTGTAAKDLVISLPKTSQVFIFADGTAAGYAGPPVSTIKGSGHLGFGLAVADLDGDGTVDIVAGETKTDLSPVSSIWMMFNQGGSTPFGQNVSLSPTLTQLRNGASPSGLGTTVATGDFDGDGKLDVAAGDPFASSSNGLVELWH